jgi:hypothetical protein
LPLVSSLVGKQVRARACRLYAYATGSAGFSAEHDLKSEDSEDRIGTLMIVLPSGFTGGDLVVKNKCTQEGEALNWAERLPKSTPDVPGSLVLPWAYVSADTLFSIKPVDSGVQLILSYDIFVPKPWMESSSASLESAFLAENLRRCLSNPEFLPEGGKVAFALTNAYPVTPSTGKKAFESKFHYQLKGADALFYFVATKLGLKVDMRTVYKFEDEEEIERVIFDQDLERDDDAADEEEPEESTTATVTGDSSALARDLASLLLTSRKMTFFTSGACDEDGDILVEQISSQCKAKAELDVIWARQPSKGTFSKSGAYATYYCDW